VTKRAQFDQIADAFSSSDRLARLRSDVVEPHVLATLGDVCGKDLLDLGCGDGVFSRLVMRGGAHRVVGVDISPEFIRIARDTEAREPLGVEYHVGSHLDLEETRQFDAALAVFVLHYADTREDLYRMCANVSRSLVSGGLLVAVINSFQDDPFFTAGPNLTRYGITFHLSGALREGDKVPMEMHAEHPFTVDVTHWSRETYARTLRDVGFDNVKITPLTPSDASLAELGQPYWQDLIDHPAAYVIQATHHPVSG
jgi:toxoflavin synthase